MTRLDNDLISRKALLEEINQHVKSTADLKYKDVLKIITNAPTIEADSGEAVGVIKSESRLEDGAELHYAYLFKHLPIGTKLFTSPPKQDSEPVAWSNGCNTTAVSALRYLAENSRPIGGNEDFNSEHLHQIADEISHIASLNLYSSPKREWRGLSDNEHSRLIWENTKLNQNLKDDLDTFSFVLNATKAIEAKLKEVNGYE